MKKLFLYLILAISLITFIFSIDDYDFFLQLNKISNVTFDNPINEFRGILDSFQSLNVTFVNGGSFLDIISNFFNFIWNIFISPIKFLLTIVRDLVSGFNIILILVGLQ